MVAITSGTPVTYTPAFRQTLDRLMGTYHRAQNPDLALELFQALGWGKGDYQLESGGQDRIFRLDIAGETSAFLFVASDTLREDAIHRAANVAYNSGVDWAAVTNFGSTRLIHSRWGRHPIYLAMEWHEYPQRSDELALLSPEAIVDGQLAASAEAAAPRDHILQPVGEDLLERLQQWRRRLVQTSSVEVDRQFHHLIGRLFFIRSCEDRGIRPRDSLLTLAAQYDPSSLGRALNAYFVELDALFRAELFGAGTGALPIFDGRILAGIIQELYTPFPELPRYRYDFAYLNVDVLGAVYEQYVATELVRVARQPSPQPSLFGDSPAVIDDVVIRSRRREGGIFYTPPYLVNYLIQHTVEPLLKRATTLAELPRVADLSCGSGAFLTRAAERLAARARELASPGQDENWYRRVIPQLIGIDRDERAVTLARVNLWILATMGEPPQPLPDLDHRIDCADALFAPEVDDLRGQLDAIVGNPPFRSSIELDAELKRRLGQRYATATGRFDLAYVFIERALQLVRPGGIVGFVLPNRLFLNDTARYLRDQLAQLVTIERIVDFGHLPLFTAGKSYVALLIARKRASADEAVASSLTLYRLRQLTEHPGLQLRRAEVLAERGMSDDNADILHMPQPTNGAPWIWTTPMETALLAKLREGAQPLGEVANIRQGVKTGDNGVFLLRYLGQGLHADRWRLENGLGQQIELEPKLLRPCLQGQAALAPSAITRNDAPLPGQRFLLYPYRDGAILDWPRLASEFPATAAYLNAHSDRLTGRRSIAGRAHRPWYGLSEPRDATWLNSPKLLTYELVASIAFVPDRAGRYTPIGEIAILPLNAEQISLDLLLGILNSSLAAWYLGQQAARYDDDYAKLTPGHLRTFPFPWPRLLTATPLADRIASLASGITDRTAVGLPSADLRDEIDTILGDFLGLMDQQQIILRNTQLRPTDVEANSLPPATLANVEIHLNAAAHAASDPQRDRSFLAARDILAAILDREEYASPQIDALLTFALVCIGQLRRLSPDPERLGLVRELLAAARTGGPTPTEFIPRLRKVGLNPLPVLAGASTVLLEEDDVDAGRSDEMRGLP